MKQKTKALILAAGFGQRLVPITHLIPKPMLPILGTSLIELILDKLSNTYIQDIAINCHHLPTAFYPLMHYHRQHVHLIQETHILGTGGAIKNLHLWRDSHDLLVINGDIVTDMCINALLQSHYQQGLGATLALIQQPHTHTQSSIYIDHQNIIHAISDTPHTTSTQTRPHGFACMQVISNDLLNQLWERPHSNISDFYKTILHTTHPLTSSSLKGIIPTYQYWWDVGSPSQWFNMLAHMYTLTTSKHTDLLSTFGFAIKI